MGCSYSKVVEYFSVWRKCKRENSLRMDIPETGPVFTVTPPSADGSHIDNLYTIIAPGEYFIDEEFSATKECFYYADEFAEDDIQWRRPHVENRSVGSLTNIASSCYNDDDADDDLPPEKQSLYFVNDRDNQYIERKIPDDEINIDELLDKIPPDRCFTDDEFLASDESLFLEDLATGGEEESPIVWKRPHELVSDPQLYVEGTDRRDVVQGTIGDCWFLSACAAVARKQSLIEWIIPPKQSLKGENYKGVIVCRFWRFGDWVTVCVDDLLPTLNGELIYAKSENPNEFWVSLLEKAFAKLNGSYRALEGGHETDAFVALTGGISERIDKDQTPDKTQIFTLIANSIKNGAFITGSFITGRLGKWIKSFKVEKYGLEEGHTYTITGVARVTHKKKKIISLIRLRNPWSDATEWIGKWSDGDKMWTNVSEDIRIKLLTYDTEDGEFWMSFNDFYKHFDQVSLCTMGPDFDKDGEVDKAGMVLAIKGSWIPGVNAGGSYLDYEKFSTNPQYLLTIKEFTDNAENPSMDLQEEKDSLSQGKSQVLIGVMQEHRQSVSEEKAKKLSIGFRVYETNNPNFQIQFGQPDDPDDVGTNGMYWNLREVICRLELEPGYYVIIPSTFEPDIAGSFMVRVYSPNAFELKSLD